MERCLLRVTNYHNAMFRTFLFTVIIFAMIINGFVEEQNEKLSNNTINIETNASIPSSATTTVSSSTQVGNASLKRSRFWREWRRGDPYVHKHMWNTTTPLGKAELYIMIALLIGFVTVVVGCWLSDNCWSPEPEHLIMVA